MITDFGAVLTAAGPRPELKDHLGLFAPLIGSWSLHYLRFEPDGTVTESAAEWHFTWALDGRAVTDVWINPSRATRGPASDGEWGMSVRFYDPALGAWRSTWHGPQNCQVMPFIARACDEGIVIEGGQYPDGTPVRCVFSAITPASFLWRAEVTDPTGITTIRQRIEATRTA